VVAGAAAIAALGPNHAKAVHLEATAHKDEVLQATTAAMVGILTKQLMLCSRWAWQYTGRQQELLLLASQAHWSHCNVVLPNLTKCHKHDIMELARVITANCTSATW
jgi:hypothetical protein